MSRAIGSVRVKKNGNIAYNSCWELRGGKFASVDNLLSDPKLAEQVRNKAAFKRLQRLLSEARGVHYV
jgi:hypothetical protein